MEAAVQLLSGGRSSFGTCAGLWDNAGEFAGEADAVEEKTAELDGIVGAAGSAMAAGKANAESMRFIRKVQGRKEVATWKRARESAGRYWRQS